MSCVDGIVRRTLPNGSSPFGGQRLRTGAPPIAPAYRPATRRCCAARRRSGRRVTAASAAAITLTRSNGSTSELSGELYTIGSGASSDIPITHSNCLEDHARLELKQGRVYCTALAGDPDDFLCSTFTWLNGNELRRGVAYLVKPGSKLSFGQPDDAITVEFEEGGGVSPALEMVMQGMASSDDIKKRISGD